MNNPFSATSDYNIKYSAYEYRKAANGRLYICPKDNAAFEVYKLAKSPELLEQMIIDGLNIGMLSIKKKSRTAIKAKILDFVTNYGLLGFITALPTTVKFVDYEAVYLPKNHFIKEETLPLLQYLKYFFPFKRLDITSEGQKFHWTISDRSMMAIAIGMNDYPESVIMSFQREYAEPYEWLEQAFLDLAFTFYSAWLYCTEKDKLSENELNLFRQGIAVFGGIAPTYHIELLDQTTIVWEFNSLLRYIQMVFSLMVSDTDNPLKLCPNCNKVFIAHNPKTVFCSPDCKNAFNVAKNRSKK